MTTETPGETLEPAQPTPWGPAWVAVLLHALLLSLYLLPWSFDLSALVCASEDRPGRPGYEVVGVGQKGGYDGQFYFLIAQQAPWLRLANRADLDSPARHLRVLYPATAWFLSTGDPQKLLLILPLVNLLAIGMLAYAGSVLARARGLSPWWGVLLPFAVNAGLPLFRDLADALGLALLALLLVGWVQRWSPGLLALLALGTLLTREVFLLPLAVLGVVALCQRRWTEAGGLAAAAACWGLWVLYVGWLYQEKPFLPAEGNFGPPLAGLATAWSHTATLPGSKRLLEMARLLATVALPVAVLVVLLWRRRGDVVLVPAALAGLVLVASAGWAIWQDYWAYARVLTLLPLATWLACVNGRCPGLAAALSLAGVVTLAAVARQLHIALGG